MEAFSPGCNYTTDNIIMREMEAIWTFVIVPGADFS